MKKSMTSLKKPRSTNPYREAFTVLKKVHQVLGHQQLQFGSEFKAKERNRPVLKSINFLHPLKSISNPE